MKKHPFLLAAVALAATACVRLPAATPPPTDTPPSASTPTATRVPLDLPEQVIVTSSSLSLIVDDPTTALADLEALVADAGGYVSSASSWSDTQNGYASLSAEVPPEALPGLRVAAIDLALRVSSNSVYSQDVTSEVAALQERLALIDESEERLLQILLGSEDPALAKAYVMIAALFEQERENTRRQLEGYQEQAGLSSFDVTLNREPILLEVYPGPTPTPFRQ
jgi:hypothetical protein